MATYSNPASLADIISALNAYSLITTIYYQNTTDVVFSTSLNSKYFRINYSTGKIRMYFKETLTPTQILNESRTISSGTFTLVNKPIVPNSDDFYSAAGHGGTHWVRGVNYTINSTTGVVTNINMSGTVYCDYQYLASITTDFKVFTDFTSGGTLYKTHIVAETNWFVLIGENATTVANEAKTISGGAFTLTNKPIKNGSDEFYSGSGKTGTHWIRDTDYTINNTTGVVTNINMVGTVYANYVYPVASSNFGYVGCCDSGRDIILGGNGYSSIGAYNLVHRCRDLTNGIEIEPVLFGGIAYDSGNVITETLILKDKSSGQLLKNGSNPDGVVGVKSVAHATTEVYTDGSSYLFFQAPWYLTADGLTKATNLLFQW
jgi:hypothetical protein